jgi:hypothetical protein
VTQQTNHRERNPLHKRSGRPTYLVRLRPEPNVVDSIRALHSGLKSLLRRNRLRCVSVREEGQ